MNLKENNNIMTTKINNNDSKEEIPKFDDESIIVNQDNISEDGIINNNFFNQVDIDDVRNYKFNDISDPFIKWIDSLNKIVKDYARENNYNMEKVEKVFSYDPKKDFFTYWLSSRIVSLKNMYGDNISDVFKQATNSLEPDDRKQFIEEFVNFEEFYEYFEGYSEEVSMDDSIKLNENEKNIQTIVTGKKNDEKLNKIQDDFSEKLKFDIDEEQHYESFGINIDEKREPNYIGNEDKYFEEDDESIENNINILKG